MAATPAQLAEALDEHPALQLLGAYSRDWVLPLFAEHLEPVDGTVSAEWFHERVAEALEARPDWKGDRTPVEHCRKWVDDHWLDTEYEDGRLRYRLSAYALRAIQIVREIIDGQSAVSASRLGSIAHAVHTLAGMANPDRHEQALMLDAQIAELQRKRDDIDTGRTPLATVEEMRQQLAEILAMTRSLPADFRQLRALVEDRHQRVARHALTDAPTKREMVEDYLREHDLLSQTAEGRSYLGFAQLLSSDEAQRIREDIDQILAQDFARDHMTSAQRTQLEMMFYTLLSEDLRVQQSYVRWTGSLRRFLSRSAPTRQRRLLSLIDQALSTGAEWVLADPGRRPLDTDVIGIGTVNLVDASGLRGWKDTGRQTMIIEASPETAQLPADDRAALRLAAGTSPQQVARNINRLLATRHLVTGAEVFEDTPQEFQRLGTLVSLLDLAVSHGRVDSQHREAVRIAPDAERALHVVLPHLLFDRPIDLESRESA